MIWIMYGPVCEERCKSDQDEVTDESNKQHTRRMVKRETVSINADNEQGDSHWRLHLRCTVMWILKTAKAVG